MKTSKKNPKRLQCLKKKSKELSILCDVDVLFICKHEDPSSSTSSFDSWPEDSESCLQLIHKYNKIMNAKNAASTNFSVLGKGKGKGKERRHGDHFTQKLLLLELTQKVKHEYAELTHLLHGVEKAQMCVEERVVIRNIETRLNEDEEYDEGISNSPFFISSFEEEIFQILQEGRVQECVRTESVENIEIVETSYDEEEVELIPCSQPWILFDYFGQPQLEQIMYRN